jgi:hypothetical protein
MKIVAASATIAAMLFAVAHADEGDDACPHIAAFAAAPLAKGDGDSKGIAYRSVTFRFLPADIFPTLTCDGSDVPARKLCGWLGSNTSREFTEMLPEQVLGCYGFKFPLLPNVGGWKATYDLYDDHHLMLLEIVRGEPGWTEDDVRLTVFREGMDDATSPLPRLPGQPDATQPAPH